MVTQGFSEYIQLNCLADHSTSHCWATQLLPLVLTFFFSLSFFEIYMALMHDWTGLFSVHTAHIPGDPIAHQIVCVCVCAWQRDSVYVRVCDSIAHQIVCVCVWERERVCVCVRVCDPIAHPIVCVCVCVCVCVRERERECVRVCDPIAHQIIEQHGYCLFYWLFFSREHMKLLSVFSW